MESLPSRMNRTLVYCSVLVLAGLALFSQRQRLRTVGPVEEGGFLLNTGWRIRPAGTDIPLSTLPMSAAMAPDGRTMAALSGGYLPASVELLDLETVRKVSGVSIVDGWRGLAFSSSGDKLYAGGGARGQVVEMNVDSGKVTVTRRLELYPGEPARTAHLIGDIVYQNGRLLIADTAQDKILVVDAATGAVEKAIP